jgi:hypothetical protein
MTSLTTWDLTDSLAPGFKWYLHNKWPGLATGKQDWQNFLVTPGSDISLTANGVTINPSSNLGPVGGPGTTTGVNVMSCATNGSPGGYVGTALAANNGLYVDMEVFSITPSAGPLGGNVWWPVGWLWPLEMMAAPNPNPSTVDWSEIDNFETFTSPPFPRSIHWWSTTGGNSPSDHNTSFGSTTSIVTGHHSWGALIVPASQNSGTGFLQAYIDEVIDPNNTTVTWTPGDGAYSVTETNHFCILFTTGFNQPMTLRSVKVFAPTMFTLPKTGLFK